MLNIAPGGFFFKALYTFTFDVVLSSGAWHLIRSSQNCVWRDSLFKAGCGVGAAVNQAIVWLLQLVVSLMQLPSAGHSLPHLPIGLCNWPLSQMRCHVTEVPRLRTFKKNTTLLFKRLALSVLTCMGHHDLLDQHVSNCGLRSTWWVVTRFLASPAEPPVKTLGDGKIR